MSSDSNGNATLQAPRRTFIAEFTLTEEVSNTTAYFYSWRAKGATQDNASRSGSTSGLANSNSCSPIIVPFNGRISKAILVVQATGVNVATATYPCAYNANLYRVGWTTEQDSAVNGGAANTITFPIPSSVGGFSAQTSNAIVETALNISVNAGQRLALKFVNGATAATVAMSRMAFVSLIIEEVA